jgi:chemotaxis signal transduction protein
MSGSHLIFTCEGAAFALPIDQVVEVVQMVALAARLPRAPRYCLGAIDYHGKLVPLIDLGARLGLCAPRRAEALVESRVILLEAQLRPDDQPVDSAPRDLIGYVVEDVSELTDRPVSPLAADSHRFGGMVVGSVRWQDQRSALVLALRVGSLVPQLTGAELRRAIAEIAAAPRDSTTSDPRGLDPFVPGRS